ncbi:MAG: N-6 DNA methylase, partial [Sciscionella sp.]
VQHIAKLLGVEKRHTADGLALENRAAVVVPDNVLFEGGAGETIRRELLKNYDTHTLLRLPTGIFYAGGVKANVLFFDRKPPMGGDYHWTKKLWVYDFRTNQHFTLRQHKLAREALQDFVDAYAPGKDRAERVETERFRAFDYTELVARDRANLDITWLRETSDDDGELLPPEVIAQEIVEDLQAALDEFAAVAEALQAAMADADPDTIDEQG